MLDWRTDFESAEQTARSEDRDLFVYYENTRPGVHDDLRELLKDEELRLVLRGYTCCRLFRAHEPDRRFVAQYGVERAPAVIVIHRDNTYHALAGPRSAEEVVAFLRRAEAPGATPVLDALLPRRAAVGWRREGGFWGSHRVGADEPALLVYERRFSRDWSDMRDLLERPELREHLRNRDVRRVTIGWPWTESVRTPYGAISPPAVVAIRADGSHRIVQRPDTVAALAGALLGTGTASSPPPESSASESSP